MDSDSNTQNQEEESDLKPSEDKKQRKKARNREKQKKSKRPPSWLLWGLFVFLLSFALTVLFSFITEISITENSPAFVCVIMLVVLLILNISCDILANAIIACKPDAFHAMASNKIRGAKRAVSICRNASKLGSIFADVIGDICGIVSGAAGAALAIIIAAGGGSTRQLIAAIGVSAAIGALTVGGKALFKHFAIKFSRGIVFGFAKFTTFFVREKK